jgi:hypothetical protein
MTIVRKRRTREHIIADLSVNFVERQVLFCGYTIERVRADYGYDLLMFTYDANGEREIGEVYVQVKATETLPLLKNSAVIAWRLSRSDLASWLYSSVPVILIVYDAQGDQAYWLYVQRYFHNLPGFNLFVAGKTVTARIPSSQVLNPSAVLQFAGFRDTLILQTRGLINHDA